MHDLKILTVAWLLVVLAFSAQAQPLSELPGYFPFEKLEILETDELSVEINLSKPLLRLVAAAARSSEPEFAALLDSLDAVRVRVAPAEAVDLSRTRKAAGGAAGWLDAAGWQVVVRTREKNEETFIYTRMVDDQIAGMAILAIEEGGEVAVINIVGRMDLAQLEKLGETLDLPDIDWPEPTAGRANRHQPTTEEPDHDEP